uniref:Protein arginine N-methyltransferase 2-like n=1 Tax=Ailuropoda melanoleuca TaxID=9646 RepID=A0A7N5P6T2_AILME
MLADQPRTTKYHNVILQNKESLKDKVILDVGCGTGIISLFCVTQRGPAVYAVEASEMAQHTGQLVMQNGFADIITVFQQKVEDVVLPEKVDVLVSEWMGTCLLVRGTRTCGMAMDYTKEVQIPRGGRGVDWFHRAVVSRTSRGGLWLSS